MNENNYRYEIVSKLAEKSQEGVSEKFTASDCVQSMAERFRYGAVTTSADGSTFTIPRPEVFTFTPEENRIFTNEIYYFLLEYYAQRNYKVEKNSSKKRFEILKDGEVQAYIGLHHDEENSTIWWYENVES